MKTATNNLISVPKCFYIEDLYEKVTTGTVTEHKNYILVNGDEVAVHTVRSATETANYYFHKDLLGSTVAITDDSGAVDNSMDYRPFGQRRNAETWTGLLSDADSVKLLTQKGFTGHNHLDAVGLIHMKARLYDPKLGRFISPDSVIPDPYSSQSLNRYSYCENNPVSRIDPSGHISIPKSVSEAWGKMKSFFKSMKNTLKGTDEPNSKEKHKVLEDGSTDSKKSENTTPPGNDAAPKKEVNTSQIEKKDKFVYQSPLALRLLVPGQEYWDKARNSFYNDEYISGGLYVGAMLAEQGLFVATLGEASLLNQSTKSVVGTSTKEIGNVVNESNNIIQTTVHGSSRIAGANATRGGVLTEAGIESVRQAGKIMTQTDGAIVRVLENTPGRFNVVVENGKGKIITTFENISQKSLDKLGRNYGWK